jgi:alkanesulfonate monooxygenase SsuD/methylene tetrahydromethanopterin reductase-like flavin-dependent oxidoreductase (luciferase family)
MDFGIFNLLQQRKQDKPAHQIIADTVEMTKLADELGFGASWFAEHHFSNYGLCPSPLVLAAHCAALTKNIRLGPGVIIAPLYTPSRLVAEIALVDQLSGGRLNLGIGGGYQQYEFERFGMLMDNTKERTLEMLDIIERALTEKTFSYQGQFYQQPVSSISVRPRQQPLPPVWIASGDPTLMRRAIRDDHTIFVGGGLGNYKRMGGLRGRIDGICEEEGRNPADAKLALLRFCYASDDEAEIDHFVECARYQQRVAVALKTRTASVAGDYMVQEQPFPEEIPLEKIKANLPVGNVATVIERLVRDIRVMRPHHVAIHTQIGDLDHAAMCRQLELWSTKIIPAVQKEVAKFAPYTSVAPQAAELAVAR